MIVKLRPITRGELKIMSDTTDAGNTEKVHLFSLHTLIAVVPSICKENLKVLVLLVHY